MIVWIIRTLFTLLSPDQPHAPNGAQPCQVCAERSARHPAGPLQRLNCERHDPGEITDLYQLRHAQAALAKRYNVTDAQALKLIQNLARAGDVCIAQVVRDVLDGRARVPLLEP